MADSDTPQRRIGDWDVGPMLGQGSFAVVWKAAHRSSGKPAAIKEINLSRLNARLRQSLESEVSILKRISHRNIVQLYEVLEAHGRLFIVMEYCAGGDLSQHLKARGKLSEPVVCALMNDLVAGLHEMFSHHLVHRDLKPQNLLLATPAAEDPEAPPPTLKIADFGFARALGPQLLAETLCGSPLYMAPEILLSQRYDAKADLWSVGAIFFEALTGYPPYTGANQVALLRSIREREARLPHPVSVTLSPPCRALVHALLRRNVVERISFEELFCHPFVIGIAAAEEEAKEEEEMSSSPTAAAAAAARQIPLQPQHVVGFKGNAVESSTVSIEGKTTGATTAATAVPVSQPAQQFRSRLVSMRHPVQEQQPLAHSPSSLASRINHHHHHHHNNNAISSNNKSGIRINNNDDGSFNGEDDDDEYVLVSVSGTVRGEETTSTTATAAPPQHQQPVIPRSNSNLLNNNITHGVGVGVRRQKYGHNNRQQQHKEQQPAFLFTPQEMRSPPPPPPPPPPSTFDKKKEDFERPSQESPPSSASSSVLHRHEQQHSVVDDVVPWQAASRCQFLRLVAQILDSLGSESAPLPQQQKYAQQEQQQQQLQGEEKSRNASDEEQALTLQLSYYLAALQLYEVIVSGCLREGREEEQRQQQHPQHHHYLLQSMNMHSSVNSADGGAEATAATTTTGVGVLMQPASIPAEAAAVLQRAETVAASLQKLMETRRPPPSFSREDTELADDVPSTTTNTNNIDNEGGVGVVLPNAWQASHSAALCWAESASSEELLGNYGASAELYCKAGMVLHFLAAEAGALLCVPPPEVAAHDEVRLRRFASAAAARWAVCSALARKEDDEDDDGDVMVM